MPAKNGPEITGPNQSFLQAVYQTEWKNPEAKAANISLSVAIGTFVAGIAILRNFGPALVPAI